MAHQHHQETIAVQNQHISWNIIVSQTGGNSGLETVREHGIITILHFQMLVLYSALLSQHKQRLELYLYNKRSIYPTNQPSSPQPQNSKQRKINQYYVTQTRISVSDTGYVYKCRDTLELNISGTGTVLISDTVATTWHPENIPVIKDYLHVLFTLQRHINMIHVDFF